MYLLRHPFHCLYSLLSFNEYAVLSYCLLSLHLLLLHVACFTLLFVLCPPAAPFPLPFLLYLSFTAVRSLLHLPLILARIRWPCLWSPASPRHLALHTALTASRLLSLALLTYTTLYAALLLPGVWEVSWALPVLLLLLRDGLALALPVLAVLGLRGLGGRAAEEVSPFLPYVHQMEHSEPQLRGEDVAAADVKARGLTAEEMQRLGGVRRWVSEACVDGLCCICLMEMEGGEWVRRLRCGHLFHVGCVDAWLVRKRSCPKCVQSVQLDIAHTAGAESVSALR